MKLIRWTYGAVGFALVVAGAHVEQACSSKADPSGTPGPKSDSTVDPGNDASTSDGGAVWQPGDGGACTASIGGFPSVVCDPSDEQVPGCLTPADSGCVLSPKCGDPTTCEPFTQNPKPGTGVDTFRFRLLSLTDPPALANPTIEDMIVTQAVDLPSSPDAGGAPCGESGTGLFSWLMSIDKSTGDLITGGAPPTTDPFGTGYCFINGTIGDTQVAPLHLKAVFHGNSFETSPVPGTTNIPIFMPGNGAVLMLPVTEAAFHDVAISDDGNCIGSMNPYASSPQGGDVNTCRDQVTVGNYSCSRWHAGGALAGYITLKHADVVPVDVLVESFCVLLVGEAGSDGKPFAHCTDAAFSMGDYNSTTHQACSGGAGCDSFWLSAQFAASAVKVTSGQGVSLCNGGTISGSGTGG